MQRQVISSCSQFFLACSRDINVLPEAKIPVQTPQFLSWKDTTLSFHVYFKDFVPNNHIFCWILSLNLILKKKKIRCHGNLPLWKIRISPDLALSGKVELHSTVTPHLKLMSCDLNSINYIKSSGTASHFQFNLLPISNFGFNLCGEELNGLCRTSYIVFLQAS